VPRPRKFDEKTVLAAAREQFWHRGYHGTSMADLCAATGVASQSLYGAFGSKHGIFVRTLEDYCAAQIDGLVASESAATSPWAWLMAAVTFEDGGRLEFGQDGCYLAGSAVALARLDEDVKDAACRIYRDILAAFGVALHRAREAGELRPDVEIDQVALALLTAMQGIEFLSKSGLPKAQCAQAKSATVATLTRAYAVTEPTGAA
jgi:AcrR family transcriptional regulator